MGNEEPRAGEKYQHFKGKDRIYEVVAVSRDCENPSRKLVVYRQEYSGEFPKGTVWSRSLEDFLGEKDLGDGNKVKRFRRIE